MITALREDHFEITECVVECIYLPVEKPMMMINVGDDQRISEAVLGLRFPSWLAPGSLVRTGTNAKKTCKHRFIRSECFW